MIGKIKSIIKNTLNGNVQMVSISGDNSTSFQCCGDITINGKTLTVNGETVQLEGKEIYITVEGNAGNISADMCRSIEVAGDVTGKVDGEHTHPQRRWVCSRIWNGQNSYLQITKKHTGHAIRVLGVVGTIIYDLELTEFNRMLLIGLIREINKA